MASELQKAQKQASWDKLQIRGAIGALKRITMHFRQDSYDYDRTMSSLTKMGELLEAKVDRDYKELKALILSDRATSKK